MKQQMVSGVSDGFKGFEEIEDLIPKSLLQGEGTC